MVLDRSGNGSSSSSGLLDGFVKLAESGLEIGGYLLDETDRFSDDLKAFVREFRSDAMDELETVLGAFKDLAQEIVEANKSGSGAIESKASEALGVLKEKGDWQQVKKARALYQVYLSDTSDSQYKDRAQDIILEQLIEVDFDLLPFISSKSDVLRAIVSRLSLGDVDSFNMTEFVKEFQREDSKEQAVIDTYVSLVKESKRAQAIIEHMLTATEV